MTTDTNTIGEFASPTSGWSGRGTLTSLVAELDRQKATKLDFVVDSRTVRVERAKGGANDGAMMLVGLTNQAREFVQDGMPILPKALLQFGERVTPNIPTKFLKELLEQRPDRCAELITNLLHDTGNRNLIRCLEGRVRAFLSNKFRIIDHYDLAFAALDVAREKGAEVFECGLSDTSMRLKLCDRKVWDVIDTVRQDSKGSWYAGGLGDQKFLSKVAAHSKGDLPGGPGTVHPAATISNSETGHGGLNTRISILAGICFNLATVETVVARVHLGEVMEVGILSQEAIAADSKAIMLKARDAIRAAFTPETFAKLVAKCRAAAEDPIEAPTTAVNNLVANAGLSDAARDSILAHFLKDYNPTRYGLAQAVARYAQESDDADASSDIEILSGKLIETPSLLTV